MFDVAATVDRVRVLTTARGAGHPEHIYGSRKPAYWWIFRSKEWIPLPINVYVIEHPEGLVLFDTGVDPAIATDPDFWPDRVTKLFMEHIFRWDITPDDTLANHLERAGYRASDVMLAVLSHLHADHAGGIHDIPQAELFVSPEAWQHLLGPHPEREMVLRRDLLVPGVNWRLLEFVPTDDPLFADFGVACDVLGDGSMIVLPTPGHLDGAVSMFVRRADQPPVLLIGDLTYSEELLRRDQVAGTGDAKLLRESYAKVRALADRVPGLVIVAGHDHTAEEKLEATRSDADADAELATV